MSAATALKSRVEFDPAEHRYSLNGRRLPSVTEALADVGIVDYSGLPAHVREEAMDRGRKVHIATQYDDEYVFGYHAEPLDESTIAPEHAGYLEAWRRFRAEKKFRAELIEYRSYHPQYAYAGTLDRTGCFEDHPNFRVCLDIKTGTAEWWTAIQTAAYSAFFDHPRTYLRMCVELHEDGTYRLYTFHGKDWQADFNLFTWSLAIWRAKRERKL